MRNLHAKWRQETMTLEQQARVQAIIAEQPETMSLLMRAWFLRALDAVSPVCCAFCGRRVCLEKYLRQLEEEAVLS